MSTPGPRASLSLLLLLGGCALAVARRDKGAAGRAATPSGGPAGRSSGRFVSPEKHSCSWQLQQPAPGASVGAELAVGCQVAEGARLLCAYRGEPERCAAYAARSALYWKQVLSALRRKRRPCLDPAPLHARLCAGRKGPRRGAATASPPRRPGLPPLRVAAAESREPESASAARAFLKHAQSQEQSRQQEGSLRPAGEQPRTIPPNPDGLDQNAELTQTYCAEKWHSLCNFFVNFWNG